MVRKLVVLFTSVVLFAAAHAKALGLGEIVLDSALNQPLNAQIALLQLGDVRPEQISVQIADERDFARFSIERNTFLNAIEFSVQSQGANTFVQLSTAEAVREPYLSFVLETRWPSGRLLSEHTVLLDLPAFAATGSAAAIQQPVQAAVQAPQTSQNQIDSAQSSSALSTAPERLAAPAEPAPAPEEEPPEVVEEVVAEPVAPEPEIQPEPQQEESTPSPAASDVGDTVAIGSDDTLWDIALEVRPDSSVSVQQTMLALQSLNREAFISDNINMVRRGQVLRVPTLEQIRALSAREAMSEVARQNQLFENRRNVPLAAQPLTAQPQSTTDAAPGRGELSVVSVDNAEPGDTVSGSGSQSAEFDARIASLEDALAVQQEEADRAARVNSELTARLGLLEEQIASAQEIIRLRDLELAQLQQALEAAAAAEPEPVDPPTVITMAPERTMLEQVLDTLVANTYALIALVGLIILMLVFVLLRRNRAADQAALAGIDGMEVGSAEEVVHPQSNDDRETTEQVSGMSADLSPDELDEIMDIADNADAAILSEDIDFDEDDQADSSEDIGAFDADELEESADELVDPSVAEVDEAPELSDVLEEVDTHIAFDRFDAAEAMLRDAIVAEPERVDLRMKLLEVYVAKQDSVGFKLQETEIRDMGVPGVEPRIATLRSQLMNETDSEILEEGEEDFFDELSELDDMELALDLEASAEVDDNKVLAGAPVDSADVENGSNNDIDFDFAPEEDAVEEPLDLEPELTEDEDSIELTFASPEPEPGVVIEDFDDARDDAPELSAEFDLSGSEDEADSDEETISFEVEDLKPSSQESISELEDAGTDAVSGNDENAIDFDFDFAVEDPQTEADKGAPESIIEEVASEPEPESEHEVDFDFALVDEDAPVQKDEEVSLSQNTEEAEIEFDIEDADDAEIEFLDDDEEESADIDFAFDDSSFDLANDEEELPEVEQAAPAPTPAKEDEDTFDDLQFVDESIEPAGEDSDIEDDDEMDFLSDADEAATKLDLARAYFEMGDHDGAREILEEVCKEGNEEQIKDATELLNRL